MSPLARRFRKAEPLGQRAGWKPYRGIMSALTDVFSFGKKRYPKIFLSYRRHGEGAGYGGRLADKIVEHFGPSQCFRDVEDIESGADFVATINEAVGACDVLIAVIGPDWITQTNERGLPRLEDPGDFVRIEVAAALARNIRVIPVLVGGAAVPTAEELPGVLQGLARRQAHELTDTRWVYDVGSLLASIESIGIAPLKQKSHRWNWKFAVATLVLVLIGTSMLFTDWPGSVPGFGGDASVKDAPSAAPAEQQKTDLALELAREREAREAANRQAELERLKGEREKLAREEANRLAELNRKQSEQERIARIEAERLAELRRQGKSRDQKLRNAIVGAWSYRELTPEGAIVTGQTSYGSDGRTFSTGMISFQGQSFEIVGSGTWEIEAGILHETVTSSNFPEIIPNGQASADQIIDINDRELMYRDSEDGNVVVLERIGY